MIRLAALLLLASVATATAQALPQLKVGVVSSPHCMNDPNRRVTWQAASNDEHS
jgi:hypothetical protein